MAEVGILNLTINADTSQAESKLDKLAGALSRVKEAVRGGLKLSSIGKQIEDVCKKIKENIDEATITKIDKFSKALDELKGFENTKINIRINNQVSGAAERLEDTASTLNSIEDEFSNASEYIDEIIEDTQTLGESLGEASGEAAENIDALLSYLRKDVDYSNLRGVVEEMTGISRKSNVTKQDLEAFVTDSSKKLEHLMDYLENPGKPEKNALREFIDESLGIGKKFTSEDDAKELLDQADELDAAYTRMDQVRKKINGILDTLNKPSSFEGGIQAFIDKSNGIGADNNNIENARNLLANTDAIIDDANAYKLLQKAVNEVGVSGEKTERVVESVAQTTDFAAKTAATLATHQSQRIEAARNAFNDADDTAKEYISTLLGMKKEELFPGTTVDNIERAEDAIGGVADAMANMQSTRTDYGQEMVENLVNNYSKVELLTMKLNGMKQALADDIDMNRLDTQQIAERTMKIQELSEKIEELKNKEEEVKEETDKVRSAFGSLKGAIKSMFPHIEKLRHKFEQIAIRQTLRKMLNSITDGFKTGVENVYYYSKAIGSDFAPNMDSAASSLLQMKNALGAAVAPLIQSLIPILQSVVNWFINLVNYANQFLALLRGQTSWLKAVPATATAFSKQEKAAKKAGNAVKDLLADWDELNIIQSETNGAGVGAGTSAAEDYLKMFEEVSEFDNGIKRIVNFVKENFDEIKTIAMAIGAAVLGWRLSEAFTEWLPLLGKIGTGVAALATIGLTLTLTDLTGNAFIETGEPGWLIANALSGAVGSELAGQLVARILGTAAGEVTKGFTLILSGVINIKNALTAAEQEKEGEAYMLAALGSVEVGIGTALAAMGFGAGATASLALGVVTGVAALAISVSLILEAKKAATYRRMAIEAFKEQGENGISPERYLQELKTRLNELTNGSKLVVDTYFGFDEHSENFTKTLDSLKALNEVVSGSGKLTEEDATKFKQAWDIVIEELNAISKINYETIYAGLDEAIANGSEKTRAAALELRQQAIEYAGIIGGAEEMMKEEMKFLTNAISSGTATDEDIARYKEIYSILADETKDGLKEFKEALHNGAFFDFSDSENPIAAAVDFIEQMGTEAIQPALDQVKAQYDAEVAAVEASRKELEEMHKLGYITDDNYKELSDYYDSLIQTYTDRLAEQEKEIREAVQDAFTTITEQALAGYYSMDQSDSTALKSYVDNIFTPLVEAIEKAGGEVPDKIRAIMARQGEEVALSAREVYREANGNRLGIYEAFYEDMRAGNIEDGLTQAIAYEYDLVRGDISQIGEDAKKDIVNSLYEAFRNPDDMFKGLHEWFGWSYEDILSSLDLSNLDTSDLEELIQLIERLHELESETLASRSHSAPGTVGYLDWYEYQEKVKELNEAYERMKQTINGMNGGQTTVGHTATGSNFPNATGIASAGLLAKIGVPGMQTTANVDEEDLADGVQKGTELAQTKLIAAIEAAATRLMNRPVNATVNLNPSSKMGQVVLQSNRQFSYVNGELVP